MQLLQKREIQLDAILNGFYAVNQEACTHTENVLVEKSSATMFKNVAKTVMQTKLLPQDADLFSTLVGDIWQRHVSAEPVTDAYVKLITLSGLPTNKSKVLEGMRFHPFSQFLLEIFYYFFFNTYLNEFEMN